MILEALKALDKGDRSFVDAKLVAVLAILAAHNREVREELFDRVDFMMELRFALEACKGSGARLSRALLESFALLSMHAEFKAFPKVLELCGV